MYLTIATIATLIGSSFSLCLTVLLIGLVLLWSNKKQRAGRIVITFGFSLLLLFSLPFLPSLLLRQMEQQYPALRLDDQKLLNIKYIVVLGGGHLLDPTLPITSQFTYAELVRLIEGVRLYRKFTGIKLVLSGGLGFDSVSDAELMKDLSIALGVSEKDIILESESMNTWDQAEFLSPILREHKFLLVTSASHMPRAITLFKKQGMNPLAAPTDHQIKKPKDLRFDLVSLIPNSSNLRKSELIFYEYLATIKQIILGHP